MFICNCNGITEKQVKTAIRSGIERWDDVHAAYGCEPCCGKCQCDIVSMVMDAEAEAQSAPMFGGAVMEGAD